MEEKGRRKEDPVENIEILNVSQRAIYTFPFAARTY